jgi:hypothetical protein
VQRVHPGGHARTVGGKTSRETAYLTASLPAADAQLVDLQDWAHRRLSCVGACGGWRSGVLGGSQPEDRQNAVRLGLVAGIAGLAFDDPLPRYLARFAV